MRFEPIPPRSPEQGTLLAFDLHSMGHPLASYIPRIEEARALMTEAERQAFERIYAREYLKTFSSLEHFHDRCLWQTLSKVAEVIRNRKWH